MHLLERVSTLVRANLNDLLDRAEDPEKLINQLLIDMNGQLIQVRTQVAAAIASERRLERMSRENQTKASDWYSRARRAVEAGDDDLARQALARHRSYAELAEGFRAQHQQQASQCSELRDALAQLEAKVQAAEARRDLLLARSRQAKARAAMASTASSARDTSTLAHFQRMEAKIEDAELRAQAYVELESDTVEARFEHLEQEADIDSHLVALKQSMESYDGNAAATRA